MFSLQVDEQYLSAVFLHLFRSVLVRNSAIRHFRGFTPAKTARLSRRCPEMRLRLYIGMATGTIYYRNNGTLLPSFKFGHGLS